MSFTSNLLITGSDDKRINVFDLRALTSHSGATGGGGRRGQVASMGGHEGWVVTVAARNERLLASGCVRATLLSFSRSSVEGLLFHLLVGAQLVGRHDQALRPLLALDGPFDPARPHGRRLVARVGPRTRRLGAGRRRTRRCGRRTRRRAVCQCGRGRQAPVVERRRLSGRQRMQCLSANDLNGTLSVRPLSTRPSRLQQPARLAFSPACSAIPLE